MIEILFSAKSTNTASDYENEYFKMEEGELVRFVNAMRLSGFVKITVRFL